MDRSRQGFHIPAIAFLLAVLLGIGLLTFLAHTPAQGRSAEVVAGVSGHKVVVAGTSAADTIDFDVDYHQVEVDDLDGVAAGSGCNPNPVNPTEEVICGDASTTEVDVGLGGGSDKLYDTSNGPQSDVTRVAVVAGGGNDRFDGGLEPAAGILVGGGGKDSLNGEFGSNTISGGGGNDQLQGYNKADKLSGGGGNDHIYGFSGNDKVIGGAGKDSLYGDSTDATHSGKDTIVAVDGTKDAVVCGPGHDKAKVDQLDVVDKSGLAKCEQVNVKHR
jgi:Ca2+-binding RTX toxin-like protein